jgi:integrase
MPVTPLLPPPRGPHSTLEEILGDYFDSLTTSSRIRPSTLRKYRVNGQQLAALLPRRIGEITRAECLAWHQALAKQRGAALADRAAMVLRQVLNYACDYSWIPYNHARAMRLKHRAQPRVPLTHRQWEALSRALLEIEKSRAARAARLYPDARRRFAALSAVRACIALMLCPARSSEVREGKVDNWRLRRDTEGAEGVLVIPNGKTGSQLVVFGPSVGTPWMDRQVSEARQFGEYIFPSLKLEGLPVNHTAVWEAFHQGCGLAGIRDVSPHFMRVTAAVEIVELGLPQSHAQIFLNHRFESTTQVYTQLARSPAQRECATALDSMRRTAAPDVAALLGRQGGAR